MFCSLCVSVIFYSLHRTNMTALWVISTLCPFVKLIHLSLRCNPAHLSQAEYGMPNHVCVAAAFRLTDGLWSGEKSEGGRLSCCILHHWCDVSTNLCCHRALVRSLQEERGEMCSSVCRCQSDVQKTKKRGKARWRGKWGIEGEKKCRGKVGEKRQRTKKNTKHMTDDTAKNLDTVILL